jgi:hypothetical protein
MIPITIFLDKIHKLKKNKITKEIKKEILLKKYFRMTVLPQQTSKRRTIKPIAVIIFVFGRVNSRPKI